MGKKSNNSRGSQLGKMKTLRAHVKTLYDYPHTTGDLSLAAIDSLIDSIETLDTDLAAKLERYSTAVDTRQKGFKNGDDPLYKIVRQVTKLVRSDMGRKSKEAEVIQKFSVKIRGTGNRKKKKKPGKPKEKPASADQSTTDIPNVKSISRSETTFANRSKLFDDLITTLQGYGTRYTATGQYSVETLKDTSKALHDMITNSDEAHMAYKLSTSVHSNAYLQMIEIFKRVIDFIEGHYGTESPQFLAIKGLKKK